MILVFIRDLLAVIVIEYFWYRFIESLFVRNMRQRLLLNNELSVVIFNIDFEQVMLNLSLWADDKFQETLV